MYILTVKGLSKRYTIGTKQLRELWALRDVSFALNKGQILGIIGPNGAGKTTLLKVLSRVTPPTEGRVFGYGRVVPLLAIGAGFQQDLSGRENVFLNAAMYGVPAAEVERRFDEIVEFAGVADYIDMPVKRYSSGLYLRLAFSVAINMNPDILLADEVLAVGDIEFQERCLGRVAQAGQSGMSVLFVSHDMAAITRLCDKVLWLNAGEIVRIGDPESVVSEYQSSSWSLTGRRLGDSRSGSHKNDSGEILSVTLASRDGTEVGAARRADDVFIRIAVRLDRNDVTAEFTAHVRARGTLAFNVRSEEFTVREPGIYVATVRVPPNLLAATIYSVDLDLILRTNGDAQKGKVAMSAFNALSFQVFDPGAAQRDALGGVVAPTLEWTFATQRELAPAGTARTKKSGQSA